MEIVARPQFLPDPTLSQAEMKQQQEAIAEVAVTTDVSLPHSVETALIAGIDQAFTDDHAISAIIVTQGGAVVESVWACSPLEIPYIPGLLAFREGGPMIAAVEMLSVDPDYFLVDGSGQIHYREAGLATHLGVLLERPTVGVAKSLLCGEPGGSVADLETGDRVPILADDRMQAEQDSVVGYAVQTRQYTSPNRTINPLYVSPGHLLTAEQAVDIVEATCNGYKLPEPIRRADALAGTQAASIGKD